MLHRRANTPNAVYLEINETSLKNFVFHFAIFGYDDIPRPTFEFALMQMISMIDNDHLKIQMRQKQILYNFHYVFIQNRVIWLHVYLNHMSFTMFIDRISER